MIVPATRPTSIQTRTTTYANFIHTWRLESKCLLFLFFPRGVCITFVLPTTTCTDGYCVQNEMWLHAMARVCCRKSMKFVWRQQNYVNRCSSAICSMRCQSKTLRREMPPKLHSIRMQNHKKCARRSIFINCAQILIFNSFFSFFRCSFCSSSRVAVVIQATDNSVLFNDDACDGF